MTLYRLVKVDGLIVSRVQEVKKKQAVGAFHNIDGLAVFKLLDYVHFFSYSVYEDYSFAVC